MKPNVSVVLVTSFLIAAPVFAAPPPYKAIERIKIGGEGGWDYVYVDAAAHRLYASHNTKAIVIDTAENKIVGEIPDTEGIHGIALAPELGRGFTSNGRANTVTIFDLKTLAKIATVDVKGVNPDAIIYEPATQRVFTFNGTSKDATSIDAKTGAVLAVLPLNGKPEFSVIDGKGRIYVNNEDTSEIYEIEAKSNTVMKHYSIAPCQAPTGLAIDTPSRRLFSVCRNKFMAVSDPDTGKVIASLPIGAGADGVVFDQGYAYAANGLDGNLTVVGQTSPGEWEVVSSIETQRSARTIGVDPRTHKIYLPAGEFGPPAESKDGKQARPTVVPGSFIMLVMGI